MCDVVSRGPNARRENPKAQAALNLLENRVGLCGWTAKAMREVGRVIRHGAL